MVFDLTMRAQILSDFGASSEQAAELLCYNENVFQNTAIPSAFPLLDEPFVQAWEQYAHEVQEAGSILPLAKYLVQLRFPIKAGINKTDEYIAATLRGESPDSMSSALGTQWHAPERCQVVIHPTASGKIPLIVTGDRMDFVTLVRALSKRNEPSDIPASMGACMIAGYNDWARFHTAVSQHESAGCSLADAFQKVVAQKHLYQDRFIILSDGPYSGVSASAIGIPEAHWRKASLLIRREHECTHYFTRRVFSSMRNNLLDEFIADFNGITAANGRFRSDWLLHFLGLESFPRYREGGRLQNYRGEPPLSDGAFAILGSLVRQAALNLERFDAQRVPLADKQQDQLAMLLTLTAMTLEELASGEASRRLHDRLAGHVNTGMDVRAAQMRHRVSA
jgi:hypothetical protein